MSKAVQHYPFEPGTKRGSPQTAFAAAGSVKMKAASNREALYRFIELMGPYGATCDEGAEGCSLAERYSSRPRLSELKKQGLIVAEGRTRPGVSGRRQTIWILPKFAPLDGPKQGDLFDLLKTA